MKKKPSCREREREGGGGGGGGGEVINTVQTCECSYVTAHYSDIQQLSQNCQNLFNRQFSNSFPLLWVGCG